MPSLEGTQEAMAQEFVSAAERGETEVSRLAILNPDIWARVQELETEKREN